MSAAGPAVPATMRAVRYGGVGGAEVISIEQVDTPQPRGGQVLIKVAAAGMNFADIERRRGRYLEATPLPYIPGSEIAGTVVALGQGVEAKGWLAVGARVMGMCPSGGYAEYVAAPMQLLAPAPATLSDEEAAALPVQGLSAYHLLKTSARLAEGETVLVTAAAGGVGTLAVQVARLLGAGKVIAAAGSDDKAEFLAGLGADAFINYQTQDITERVKALTGGKGADVILEPVGGAIYSQCEAALARFGRLVTFGQAGGQPAQVDTIRLMRRNAAVIGFWLSTLPPARIAEGMQALSDWIAEGKLRIIVGATYPLDEVARAQDDMLARRTRGKVTLTV